MIPSRRISIDPVRVETRTDQGTGQSSSYLVGLSSAFNEWTSIVDFPDYKVREIVRPGAFSAALAERQDVRSLFNHDPNFVLGRTTSGTLSLREVDRGLLAETRLSDSATVRDLVLLPVQRGDITGQSFAFLPRNRGNGETTVDRGDGRMMIRRAGERITIEVRDGVEYVDRELLSVDLFDVTVATYPAYSGTSVGVRGLVVEADEFLEEVEGFRKQFRDGRGSRPRPAWVDLAGMRLRLAQCG
jgi:HK97 family phage prohead protease